jgi:NAD(P)-dependent dehydrogenase (short-subunit alcohol dehydrogenase family)
MKGAVILIKMSSREFGINNVGVFAPVPFTDISDEAWQEIFDINDFRGQLGPKALRNSWASSRAIKALT